MCYTQPAASVEALLPSTQDEKQRDQQKAGNDEVAISSNMPLASLGSARHFAKECRPCAWFHRPGGCQNGAECRHCHLCPDGELKVRRDTKAASMRATRKENPQQQQDQQEQWRQHSLQQAQASLPFPLLSESLSDMLKLALEPQKIPLTSFQLLDPAADAGGEAAEMLPQGTRLTPKRLEPSLFLSGASTAASEVASDVPPPPPGLSQPTLASRGSVYHALGECKPCAWFYKPKGCGNGADCLHCHMCSEGEIKARRKAKANGVLLHAQARVTSWADAEADDASVTTVASQTEEQVSIAAADEAAVWPMMQLTEQKLPSVGSQQHSTGGCRPCAWFYKPEGCANGDQCQHCHLCDVGEMRERRRVKLVAQRQQKLTQGPTGTLPLPAVQAE